MTTPRVSRLEARAEMARRSLAHFVRQAWPILEPATLLIWNWHLDVICEHVQAWAERRTGKQNLIINVPPGAMKSSILSVCLPAWIWVHRPDWRGLFASGSESIALRDSMKCRSLIESNWYRESFTPDWEFARDQNAKGYYRNTKTGFRMALSSGAKITGERANDLIIDDPNDASQDSKALREQVNYWWDHAAANRVSDPVLGGRCIIQQRLNEEDLTGHILAKERQDWDVLIIRQEWERPQVKDPDYHPTSMGWVDPRQTEGELFFPARFPADVVASEKRRLASSGYAGQHQQRPTAAEGNIFRKGFVKFYKRGAEPRFKRKFISLDTAFKEKQESDYSVALVAGEAEAGIYLLDRWKERASYPDLKIKAKTLGAAYSPNAFLIEDKASGQSLIQDLRRDTTLPIVPIQVDRDKVARANACAPTWEAGNIYVPEDAEWVDDFLDQLYGFPRMAHDDDVDAFTQLVNYLFTDSPFQGFMDFYKSMANAGATNDDMD